jgi:transposase
VEAEGGQVSLVARRHEVSTSLLYNWRSAWKAAAMAARSTAVRPVEFVQLGVVADATGESPRVPIAAGAVCARGAGLALAERIGVIEIDLPESTALSELKSGGKWERLGADSKAGSDAFAMTRSIYAAVVLAG